MTTVHDSISRTFAQNVLVYDLNTNSWNVLNDTLDTQYAQSIAHNGCIYLIGGYID